MDLWLWHLEPYLQGSDMNVFGTNVCHVYVHCLFIKHAQLKADAEDQCRLDLQQSNRKIVLIFTCLPHPRWWLWLPRARSGLEVRGLDQFGRSHLRLSPPTFRSYGSHGFGCWSGMTGFRTYKKLLLGGLRVSTKTFLTYRKGSVRI